MAFSADAWAVLEFNKASFTASVVAFTFSAWCLDSKLELIAAKNFKRQFERLSVELLVRMAFISNEC